MRLLVRLRLPSILVGNRWKEKYEIFECLVVRIKGPESNIAHGIRGATYIRADVELPEKYRNQKLMDLWNPDGTYPVEVVVNHNRKTLAPFLASGDLEWDVREEST
ncbi:hypothetical protein R69746_05638 [Paraburkholderia aspalathi]|uniref:hypothetical protein n=1 Tax=Paraburkholderia aspalathi TaxID=1324617 RepID=UPI00190B04B0|nr:hypothetical protein [Paraburkholderia aspalathi]MBK3841739.1 hypothetical protein [Paraburkholderia aspalathi]CAE6811422.1 hypothetical protein R69746_05638 [Paraburkholderia aspalathi]